MVVASAAAVEVSDKVVASLEVSVLVSLAAVVTSEEMALSVVASPMVVDSALSGVVASSSFNGSGFLCEVFDLDFVPSLERVASSFLHWDCTSGTQAELALSKAYPMSHSNMSATNPPCSSSVTHR